jgi:hypothetical protein
MRAIFSGTGVYDDAERQWFSVGRLVNGERFTAGLRMWFPRSDASRGPPITVNRSP